MQAQNNISRSFFGQCDQIGQNFAILVKKILPWTNIFGGLYFTIGPILGPIFIYLGQFFPKFIQYWANFGAKFYLPWAKKIRTTLSHCFAPRFNFLLGSALVFYVDMKAAFTAGVSI